MLFAVALLIPIFLQQDLQFGLVLCGGLQGIIEVRKFQKPTMFSPRIELSLFCGYSFK
jgi:hypothetical protein